MSKSLAPISMMSGLEQFSAPGSHEIKFKERLGSNPQVTISISGFHLTSMGYSNEISLFAVAQDITREGFTIVVAQNSDAPEPEIANASISWIAIG